MVEAIPLYDDGDFIPAKASAAVTGKRFVKISGNRDANGNIQVAHAGAGEDVFGVAQFDSAAADDNYITVAAGPGLIIPVTAGEAIAAGDAVQAGAAGVAMVLDAGVRAGKAIDAAANGADVFVQLKG